MPPKIFTPRSKRVLSSFFCLMHSWRNVHRSIALLLIILSGWNSSFAQVSEDTLSPDTLKKLSLEELMNIEIEVTSVSKRPEKLTEVASAIQVITGEDIRRSGATSLPEALRLASNLQVSQLNSYAHVISARGFNAVFSNKLLVMIDGRTVYSPLFAGVFWDVQQILLEDIERIEIVSGPGGTLWGANAVNGVINIITKNSKDSQGLYISGAAGNQLKDFAAVRYGGKIGDNFTYRFYAQHSDRNNTYLSDGQKHLDEWGISLGGFRLDWTPSERNVVMFQGNVYGGIEANTPVVPTLDGHNSTLDGQNILGTWTHTFSEKSEFIVQAYFDRTWRRDIPSTISDQMATYDIDFQHRFPIRKRHSILWGGGYRYIDNLTLNSTLFVGILPNRRYMDLYSGFIQDEIQLITDRLKFTIGTKLQHNEFTGLEIQPSARMAWTPTLRHTLWGAVSRAVRTPSRIDVDYYLPAFPLPPSSPSVAGGPNFVSEKLIAYELGYRFHPTSKLSFSLATFYNQYDDLYSVEALPGTLTFQIMNGTVGSSWGAEFSGSCMLTKKWKLRGGYTYFYKDLENKPGHIYDFSDLGNDAEHQFLLHSIINLPGNFEFDVVMRYLTELPDPFIPDYFTFDARLAWTFRKWAELSVVGQNLWEERHREFSLEIPRGVYGKITCRF